MIEAFWRNDKLRKVTFVMVFVAMVNVIFVISTHHFVKGGGCHCDEDHGKICKTKKDSSHRSEHDPKRCLKCQIVSNVLGRVYVIPYQSILDRVSGYVVSSKYSVVLKKLDDNFSTRAPPLS